MKIFCTLIVFLAFTGLSFGEGTGTQKSKELPVLPDKNYLTAGDENDFGMSKVALSFVPVGFLEFGPIINLEFGLTKNIVLNTHVRFPSLGLMTYVINYDKDGLDELSGISFGTGPLAFFGNKRSKPYAGVLFEYDRTNLLFAKNSPYEWKKTNSSIVFVCNGGYRFRFKGGFFINTGVYLGAAVTQYNWDYTDPDYGSDDRTSRKGINTTPFGMLEVTLGVEF